jgi:hypothetical protein
VIALVVTTTLALLAGTLTLGPFRIPDMAFDLRDQPSRSPRRAAQAPIMIAAPTIDVEPSSHASLLIEIGPPQWVPPDSTLQVQGLPQSVTLSQGRRVSSKLWAVPIAALSKVRIEVAADAAAGQSDVTLTLVGSDNSYLAEARTAVSINALRVAAANRAAIYTPAGIVSQRQDPDVASPSATVELAPADHSTLGRKAPETLANSAGAERSTPAAPSNPAESGRVAAPSAQQESVVASRELSKPSIALNEAAELAGAKGGPTTPVAKSDQESARPVLEKETASQREVKSAAAAPGNKEAAPSPKGTVMAQRKVVVASSEPASEVAELAGAKGGPALPAKSEAQTVHPIQREQIVTQPEVKDAAAAPADKEAAPASKGAAAVAQRETVVESRELAKSSVSALAQVAHAPRCMTAGGWGTGAFEGFASFMAETAMKNSAEATFGDAVRIGVVTRKCGQKGLLIECTARARACR